MTNASDLLPRALASFRRVCRHCGASTREIADLRVGFRCCEAAARDQVEWRNLELDRLRVEAERERAKVVELEREAKTASSYKADEAADRAARARRGFEARLSEHYRPLADELKADIARYEAVLAGEEPAFPRPYRED